MEDRQAFYLYCFARRNTFQNIERMGIDGQYPIFMVNAKDITAVLSMVSLDEFHGPEAESKLKDLSWIGPRTLRHEEIVETVMEYSPVLPARFGTIFLSLGGIEEILDTHYGPISYFLDKVRGKNEWAVKGLLDREKAVKEIYAIGLERDSVRLSSLSPGMRYLQEKRIRAGVEKDLKERVKDIGREIMNELYIYASDFTEHKVLSRDVTGLDREMIFNCAFLVPGKSADAFHGLIHKINDSYKGWGVLFELSGPWPPYSFCPSLEMA
jgi:hypothetical protein